MATLNITFENKEVKNYDNNGAHEAAKLIMKKYENLSVKFKTDKDNYEYTEALEDAVEKMGTNINDVIKKEHFGIAIKKVLMGNCITTLKNNMHSFIRNKFCKQFVIY